MAHGAAGAAGRAAQTGPEPGTATRGAGAATEAGTAGAGRRALDAGDAAVEARGVALRRRPNHRAPPPRATSTSAAPAPTFARRPGAATNSDETVDGAPNSCDHASLAAALASGSRAAPSARRFAKRAPGSRAIERTMRSSRRGSSPGACTTGLEKRPLRIALSVAKTDGPFTGSCPVTHSYITTPRAY